jgi:hypothetical protein
LSATQQQLAATGPVLDSYSAVLLKFRFAQP